MATEQSTWDQVKNTATQKAEEIKNIGGDKSGQTQDAAGDAKAKAEEGKNVAGQKAGETGDKTKDTMGGIKEKLGM